MRFVGGLDEAGPQMTRALGLGKRLGALGRSLSKGAWGVGGGGAWTQPQTTASIEKSRKQVA